MGVGLAFRKWSWSWTCFRELVNRERDRQTDRHCEILSPLALRAGGEKISIQTLLVGQKVFFEFKGHC